MSLKKNLFFFLLLVFSPHSFAVEPITTSGNQVLIGGQTGSLAGNSFFWSNFGGDAYYNRPVVSWLKDDWNATIVRAAMGVEEFNGFLSNPNLNRNAVEAVVEAAIAEDIYVIIDWHTHNAESNTQAAVNFFSEMAEQYGDNENVLFEIYNEPIGDFNNSASTWNSIKNYATPVIAAIREHSDNLIIVGTPFYSQRVDTASESPITGVQNLAYTLHFYAGTHGESLRNTARTALNNGIPLFVTEWGAVNADGNGGVNESSTREWMDFLEENNISHLNWAVNDKAEGASVLIGNEQGANNQGNWPISLLTASGRLVRDIVRNWPSVGGGITPPPSDAVTLPALLQAEDYDRQSGTQTENTQDTGGGSNVGYIVHNDYLEFDVNVPAAGSYNVDFRLASSNAGGNVLFQVDGQTLGQVSIGSTGGWQNWVTQSTQVQLQAGEQTIRILFSEPSSSTFLLNINWVDITSSTPASNLPTIPSLIQAEDFDRQSGIQTEGTSDNGGGLNIGYIENNDYVEYDVNVSNTGNYRVDFRLASATGGGNILLQVNGQTRAQVSTGFTGGWQSWNTQTTQVQLESGDQTIRLLFSNPSSSQGLLNVNWIDFTNN